MSVNRSWPLVPLRELCIDDGQYGTSEKSSTDPTDLPVLRMGNLVDGEIDWTDLKYLEASSGEARKCSLQKGVVLFNRTNSVELVGKSAVFNGEREAVFASYLVRFRMKAERADPYFVSAYINSEFGRAFINANMVRAIGQANVSASVMQRMQVPAPPLQEQRKIAARLREQLSLLAEARIAIKTQLSDIASLIFAQVRGDTHDAEANVQSIEDVLVEVTEGVGDNWHNQPVLGATRAGLAPAKEPVGKQPERYKPVTPGTIFYNPMRILLGSIAIVDEGDSPGITSPDYVVIEAARACYIRCGSTIGFVRPPERSLSSHSVVEL